MAQTGYTPLQIYSSSTGGAAPAAGNLTNSTLGSELAINITDGKLFYKDNANAVQVIAWKTTPTTAGGTGLTSYTAGDLLYYATGTTLTKLGIGSAYQALQVNAGGTAPSWQPSATSVLTAQGDLLYASAANTLARLAKSTTATRYLANTGSNNNPQWDQINLANGVTGTLPVANGGSGTATAFTAGSVLFAGASGVYSQDNASFFWDNSNKRLGLGTASPAYRLDVQQSAAQTFIRLLNTATSTNSISTFIVAANNGGVTYQLDNDGLGSVFGAGIRAGTTTNHFYNLRTNNTDRLSIAAGGDITLNTGNLIQGTAAKGINFTANTPAAGMTSQLLNWYEEGTWTPVLTRSGGAPTISYTTQVGSYVRIGKMVFIKFNITWTGLSGSSGYYKVTGLPFTMTSGSAFEVIPVIDIAGITFTAGYTQIACEARQSTTELYVVQAGSNVTTATFTSGFAAAGTLIASGCYRVD